MKLPRIVTSSKAQMVGAVATAALIMGTEGAVAPLHALLVAAGVVAVYQVSTAIEDRVAVKR